MKTLIIARLTLKRMARSHYLIPVITIALFSVMFFFGHKFSHSTLSRALIINSSSLSLSIITFLFFYIGTVFLAVFIIPGEILTGHMRMNLSKPITPLTVLFGHFLGMVVYLAAGGLIMATLLTLVAWMKGAWAGFLYFQYIFHLLPLYACLLSLGMVLALVTNRPLAAFFTLIIALEGHWYEISYAIGMSGWNFMIKTPMEYISRFFYIISPPIKKLKIDITRFMELDFPWGNYMLVLLYCLTYIAIAHLIAAWLLDRKEI